MLIDCLLLYSTTEMVIGPEASCLYSCVQFDIISISFAAALVADWNADGLINET